MQRRILLVLVALALAASASGCEGTAPESPATTQPTSTSRPTATSLPTDTSVPTDTAAPTDTPTPTPIPSPTPTTSPTALPEDLKEEILETWRPLLVAQMNAGMLLEAAAKVQAGELAGFESLGTLIAISAFVAAVDEALPAIEPMPELQGSWNEMLTVHERTKEILAAWYNDEIDSAQVIEQAEPLVADAESALSSAERVLANEYGVPAEELSAVRQEALQEMRDVIGATATPAP